MGNVATNTNYAGELTEYQYDSTRRLVGLRNRDYLSVSYQYDPAGRLLNRILSNGSQTDYAYDAANRLSSLINRSPTGVLESNVYGRDRVWNITSLNESVRVGAATFGYDKLHRLRMADYPGTVNDRCYTYDRVGNRKRETQGNVTNCLTGTAPTPTYSYDHDADNRLTDQRQGTGTTQVAHFDYDDNGNLITRWGSPGVLIETLTYDPKNRLKSLVRGALQPTFRYDPFDYRTEKTIAAGNARRYYLEGEHLELVTDANNGVLGKYLRGVVIDEIVNGYQRPLATDDYSIWSWQHDAVGSVTQLVRHEGTAELAQRYLPFGEKTISQPLTSFFGYTGREEDENGTYYYRARYYDPALGRFLGEDPIGFNASINFYAYVGNNPLVASDPLGLKDYYVSFNTSLISPLLQPQGLPLNTPQPAVSLGIYAGTGADPGRGFLLGVFHQNSTGMGDDAGIAISAGWVTDVSKETRNLTVGVPSALPVNLGILNLVSSTASRDMATGGMIGQALNLGIGPTLCGCSVTESTGASFGLSKGYYDFVQPARDLIQGTTDFLFPRPPAPGSGVLRYPSTPNISTARSAYLKFK